MDVEPGRDWPLTLPELRAFVREAAREGLREEMRPGACPQAFRVDPETHYQHHQMLVDCRQSREAWEADHAFVAELRRGVDTAKGAALKSLAAALVTAILAGLVLLFRKV